MSAYPKSTCRNQLRFQSSMHLHDGATGGVLGVQTTIVLDVATLYLMGVWAPTKSMAVQTPPKTMCVQTSTFRHVLSYNTPWNYESPF